VKPSGHPLSDLSLGDQVAYFQANANRLFAAMVPMQVYNSLQVDVEAERLRSIHNLIIGGGAIDDKLALQLKDFPHAVWSTYGMTETLSHIALRRLNGSETSEWYRPFDSVKVSINEEGCLVIDAPLVHEGKLVTNDRAELRERDGKIEFKILGRKDNVIDSGGIKIQIEEVEKKLKPFLSSPYMITKGPDEKFGETVILLTEQNNIAEVSEICMKALPKYWQPHYIFHVDKIPMTETSKPARAQAQKLALSLL
jgi:O-succinylbenzoic acid--CoA ligase